MRVPLQRMPVILPEEHLSVLAGNLAGARHAWAGRRSAGDRRTRRRGLPILGQPLNSLTPGIAKKAVILLLLFCEPTTHQRYHSVSQYRGVPCPVHRKRAGADLRPV